MATKIPNINGSTAVLLNAVKPVIADKSTYKSRENALLYDAIINSIWNKIDASEKYQKELLNKTVDGILGRINSLLIQKQKDGELPSSDDIKSLISDNDSSVDNDTLAEIVEKAIDDSIESKTQDLLEELSNMKEEAAEETADESATNTTETTTTQNKSSILSYVNEHMKTLFNETILSDFKQISKDLNDIKLTAVSLVEQFPLLGKMINTVFGPFISAYKATKALISGIWKTTKLVASTAVSIAKGVVKTTMFLAMLPFKFAAFLIQFTIATVQIMGAIGSILVTLSPYILIFLAVVAAVWMIYKGWQMFSAWWDEVGGFEGIVTKVGDAIVDAATATWEWIKDFGGFLWSKLKEFGQFLYNKYIEPVVLTAKSIWNDAIKPAIEKIKEFGQMLKQKLWLPVMQFGSFDGEHWWDKLSNFFGGFKVQKYYPFLDQFVDWGKQPTVNADVKSEFAVTPVAGPTVQAAQQIRDVQNISNYNSAGEYDNSDVTTGIDALADGNAETQDQIKKFQVSADEKLQTLIDIMNEKQMGVMPVPMQSESNNNQASKDN